MSTPEESPATCTQFPAGSDRVAPGLRFPGSVFVLPVLLAFYLGLEAFLPLSTSVQIGADEGFELAKATLCLRGHKLYSEIWNDQPPLHTFFITQVLKLAGNHQLADQRSTHLTLNSQPSTLSPPHEHSAAPILLPRLVTIGFALLLLASLFFLVRRFSDVFTAAVATAFVIVSPGFLQLSASCMLEVPSAATALAALALLAPRLPANRWLSVSAAGALFGLAVLIKLVPAYLLPLVPLLLWGCSAPSARTVRDVATQSVVFGCFLLLTFITVDLLIEGGAFFVHFRQSWASHFGPGGDGTYGSAAAHPFQWAVLLKNWDLTLPACVGLVWLIQRTRARTASQRGFARRPDFPLFPACWLVLAIIVFSIHRPWWPYYYIHLVLPLAWCAAIGIAGVRERLARPQCRPTAPKTGRHDSAPESAAGMAGTPGSRLRPARALLLSLSGIFVVSGIAWSGVRVYLQVLDTRRSPQTYAEPLLAELARFKPGTRFMFTQDPIYSFHSGIPIVPSLAVLPFKRFWCGEMTDDKLAGELTTSRPELVLVPNGGNPLPYEEWLTSEYRLAYRDRAHRLFPLRSK